MSRSLDYHPPTKPEAFPHFRWIVRRPFVLVGQSSCTCEEMKQKLVNMLKRVVVPYKQYENYCKVGNSD